MDTGRGQQVQEQQGETRLDECYTDENKWGPQPQEEQRERDEAALHLCRALGVHAMHRLELEKMA